VIHGGEAVIKTTAPRSEGILIGIEVESVAILEKLVGGADVPPILSSKTV
jgi:hypothetical protein